MGTGDSVVRGGGARENQKQQTGDVVRMELGQKRFSRSVLAAL